MREKFDLYLDFKYYDVKKLKAMARFFGMTPMTGVNTFNNLIKLSGRRVSSNHHAL